MSIRHFDSDIPEFAQLVAAHTNDAIIVTDSQGRIVWVNAAFEQLTEYPLIEAIGCKPGDLLQGENTDRRAINKIGKALKNAAPVRVEIENYSKSGRQYLVELQINPVFDEENKLKNFIAVQRDVTSSRVLEDDSLDLSAYREALDRQAIVSVADRRGRISFVNDNFCRISGYAREELVGRTHSIVNSAHHSRAFFDDMWRTIAKGGTWHGEVRNRRKDGTHYWVDTTIVPVLDNKGRPLRYVSIRYDITIRKTAEEDLIELAQTDSLTGLSNREVFQAELENATLSGRSDIAVLLLDMDHFKEINDTLGHAVGDELLREAASRLKKSIRSTDTVARLGGDEFALIVTDLKSSKDCVQFADRLFNDLTEPVNVNSQMIEPSFSIGIARFPGDGSDPDTLLKNADIAMYEAKRNGRGQWSFFDSEVAGELFARQTMLSMIRKGVENEEFSVVLQPQREISTGDHRGFEALVRWTVDGETVPPSIFIPVIEESRKMFTFSEMIWRKALSAHAELRRIAHGPSLLAINASPFELRSSEFSIRLQEMSAEYGIPLSEIEVELTETALVGRASSRVATTLQELKELGVQIALDDFGTGFSSLSHLRSFPVDLIKIDREFVSELDRNSNDQGLVSAILALAKELNLETIAEGVETEEQMQFLNSKGCTYGQGYFISKPLALHDAKSFLSGDSSIVPFPQMGSVSSSA
ncbi:MAG: EAL domain-containing protein [Pseudomonadota bacterium]